MVNKMSIEDHKFFMEEACRATNTLDTALARFMRTCRSCGIEGRVNPIRDAVSKDLTLLWAEFATAMNEMYPI